MYYVQEEGSNKVMFDWILDDQSDSATQILGSNLCVGERSQWELICDRELAVGNAEAVWYGASSKVDYRSYNGRFT